jgi:hypothetical protein
LCERGESEEVKPGCNLIEYEKIMHGHSCERRNNADGDKAQAATRASVGAERKLEG